MVVRRLLQLINVEVKMLVKVKNLLDPTKYSCFVPEFYEYEGDEVPSPSWAPNSLCLTTGDPSWPYRIINRDRIVSINNSKVEHAVVDNIEKTYQFSGSKNKTYIVTVSGNNISCTCPGFNFRGRCKHVTEVMNEMHKS